MEFSTWNLLSYQNYYTSLFPDNRARIVNDKLLIVTGNLEASQNRANAGRLATPGTGYQNYQQNRIADIAGIATERSRTAVGGLLASQV